MNVQPEATQTDLLARIKTATPTHSVVRASQVVNLDQELDVAEVVHDEAEIDTRALVEGELKYLSQRQMLIVLQRSPKASRTRLGCTDR